MASAAGVSVSVPINSADKEDSTGYFGASTWGGLQTGDWVVNVPTSAGAGLSVQGGASSMPMVAGLALACLAVWLLLRKKGRA